MADYTDEEGAALDPSTPFIDATAAGPQIAAPGDAELDDADETLEGGHSATPGTVVNPPAATATALGSGLKSNTQIQGNFAGLVEPGNIDLTARPQVKNPDGSTSTVRSASFGLDGKEVLLPTVSDGPNARLLSDDEAIAQYRKTGKHLGKFANPDAADAYAEALHKQQSTAYGLDEPKVPGTPQEAGAGAFNATQEGVAAGTDKANAVLEESDVEKQRLAQAAQDEDDIRVQRELEAQSQLDARNEFMAKKNAADEKVRDFKFHDYYEDPKHQSAVLDKFAVFLGGLGNLGGQNPGAANHALDTVEGKIRADHDEQLSYLNSAKYFADKQAEGYTDLLKQQQSDRHDAELEYANKKLATADKFAELAQTARGKQGYDAAMIEVAKLKKSAYDDQQKVFSDISAQKLQDARAAHQLQLANRHKGGGTGAGNGAAFTAFTDAAGALKPGDPIPKEVVALALKAHIKPKDIADQVKKYAVGANPVKGGGASSQTFDPSRAVYGEGHELKGYVGARTSPDKITQRISAFQQSIRFLEKLYKSGRVLPVGADLHNAALALVGTTTGPANEITQKHEEGALKDAAGLLDPEAIKVRLDDAKERYQQLLDSLIQPSDAKPAEGKAKLTPAQIEGIERLKAIGATVNP